MSERPVYQELARFAVNVGFVDTTAAMVHKWVTVGLLPRTGKQMSRGRHGFVTTPSPDVKPQLLALCQWRRHTKSWGALYVLLWLEAWPIALGAVRSAMRSSLPRFSDASEVDEDELSSIVVARGPRIARRLPAVRASRADVEDASEAALRMAIGIPAVNTETARALERATGQDRGRFETVAGLEPWLKGEAAENLGPMAHAFSVNGILDLADSASEVELERARPRALFFVRDAPRIVGAVEARAGRNFAGFRSLAPFRPADAPFVVALMVFYERIGLSTGIDGLMTLAEPGSASELRRGGQQRA